MLFFSFVGIGFSSWQYGENSIESTATLPTTEDRAVCYNSTTNISYTSLKSALNACESNQTVIVYIGSVIECDENITIPTGVTLTVPFIGKAYDSTKKADNISDTPYFKIPSVDQRNAYGNTLGDSNAASVNKYRSSIINLRNGADIIIYGTFNLGGAFTTNGNNGFYCEINLGKGSSIQCKSGSLFECHGYVKEDGNDYVNPLRDNKESFDNSIDEGRFIEVENGAKLTTDIAMYDAPTAGNLTLLINASQCPFWEWDFPCLQTYIKINSGSTFSAYCLLIGPSNMGISKEVVVFSSNTDVQSLFYISSGYVGIEYLTKEPLYSSREFNARHTNVILSGEMSVGYLYVKEGAYSAAVELDTRNCFLPISCRMDVIATSGSKFTSDKKMKFLAGSKLLIQEGAEFEINNEVIFHKHDSIIYNTSSGLYYRCKDEDNIDDARLICNGTLTFNSDGNSNGAIGAYVEHENNDGSAKFDVSNLTDSSKLSVKDVEGANESSVLITSIGLFEDGTAQFIVGNSYSSLSSNEKYYWNGAHLSTCEVQVKVLEGSTNAVALYTLQYADDSNGTNEADSDLLNVSSSGTTKLPVGKYIKLILTRGEKAVIKDTSGNIVNTDSSTYILLDRDYIIEITPSETYNIDFTIEKDNDNVTFSGTGHFTFEIWECKTKEGTYIKVFDGKYNASMKTICKNSYFYIKRPFENEVYNYFKNANAEITKTPDVGDKPDWNVKNSEQSPIYFADANYSFKTYWTYTCILPNAKVLMADGSYKPAGEIRTGDMVISFNHETGKFEPNKVIGNDDLTKPAQNYNVIHLEFTNGKTTDFVYEHGYFDTTLNKYVYLHEEDASDYIGHEFVFYENGQITRSKLCKVSQSVMYTTLASPATANHLNFIVDDMLTIGGGLTGLFNIFEYDSETLAFDKDKMQKDIDTYGLLGYEYFEDYFPEEIYELLPCKYLGVSIGKGLITWDVFESYVTKWKDQLMENI